MFNYFKFSKADYHCVCVRVYVQWPQTYLLSRALGTIFCVSFLFLAIFHFAQTKWQHLCWRLSIAGTHSTLARPPFMGWTRGGRRRRVILLDDHGLHMSSTDCRRSHYHHHDHHRTHTQLSKVRYPFSLLGPNFNILCNLIKRPRHWNLFHWKPELIVCN